MDLTLGKCSEIGTSVERSSHKPNSLNDGNNGTGDKSVFGYLRPDFCGVSKVLIVWPCKRCLWVIRQLDIFEPSAC